MNQAVFDLFNSLIVSKHRDPVTQIKNHAPILNIAGLDLVFKPDRNQSGYPEPVPSGAYVYTLEGERASQVPDSEVCSGIEWLRIFIYVCPELDHFKVSMLDKTYRVEYGLVKYDEQRELFLNVSSIEKAVTAVEDFLKRGFGALQMFEENTIL